MLTRKSLCSLWVRGHSGEPFPCCSIDPLSTMEANSIVVMGMVCSSAVGLLCSALLKRSNYALFPVSFLLGINFEEGVGPVPEAPQDDVFWDVIFTISFTDGSQNTVFVTANCSSVLSNHSLDF